VHIVSHGIFVMYIYRAFPTTANTSVNEIVVMCVGGGIPIMECVCEEVE